MVDAISPGPHRLLPGRASTPDRPREQPASAPIHAASLPRLVNLAADLARQGPPVDFARLAPIRQAIAIGSYRVDPEAIASAMLAQDTDRA